MRASLAAVALILAAAAPAAADPTVINGDAGFPEGPIVEDGKLIYAQYGTSKITMWDGKTNTDIWSQEGCGPSAVIGLGEGYAVTCYDSGQLVRISRDGKTTGTTDKDEAGNPLVGPNDATSDGKGGIYFTTSGPWEPTPIVGRVLHMAADGSVRNLADDLHYANGIALSPDGTTLYVNESEAGRVITFKIGADGALSDRRLFVRLTALDEPPEAYPDGLKFGPDGNLYIGQYSAGRVVVVDKDGKLVRKIEVPSTAAPNLAFSADGKTIYVMAVDDKSAAPYKGKVYAVPYE
jgi:sugar lactone lactonase YvrE